MFCTVDSNRPSSVVPYTVQFSDTFYKISRYYSITLDDLIEANPQIDPDCINAGDVLYISMDLQNVCCPKGAEPYTIQAGDSIYKLAKKYSIRLDSLLSANPEINPDALLPGQIVYIPKPFSKYINSMYKISFSYPSKWAKVNNMYYEGMDGFFRISSINSDKTLEDICTSEMSHRLHPYGMIPETVPIIVSNCKACLILPSKDQPSAMKNQAVLILEYPQNFRDILQRCSHIMLWADKGHIQDITKTFSLIG